MSWRSGRRIIVRGDVPGRNYNPEDSVILDTDEKRESFRLAVDAVMEDSSSAQGPSWARGRDLDRVLTPENVSVSVDEGSAENGGTGEA